MIGSNAACARKGTSYADSSFFDAPAMTADAFPSFRTTTPEASAAAASPLTTSAVLTVPFGPSSQRSVSASMPFFAAHMWSATTATASSRRTIWLTPTMALALLSSTLTSLPPTTGLAATAAIFIPGSRTSMPYCVVPFTFAGVSRRLAGVPISLNSLGSFKATCAGTGSFAAVSASAPYDSLRPVAACVTTPLCARHDAGSTFQVSAAAARSMVRAVAPARRSGSYSNLTEVDAPVICMPKTGRPYNLSSGGACSRWT